MEVDLVIHEKMVGRLGNGKAIYFIDENDTT